MSESHVDELYEHLVRELDALGLAYLHILETASEATNRMIRETWSGTLVVNPSLVDLPRMGQVDATFADLSAAHRCLEAGADLVSFGRSFISNPDLVHRFAKGCELTRPDLMRYYGGGDDGYTDYPVCEACG